MTYMRKAEKNLWVFHPLPQAPYLPSLRPPQGQQVCLQKVSKQDHPLQVDHT